MSIRSFIPPYHCLLVHLFIHQPNPQGLTADALRCSLMTVQR